MADQERKYQQLAELIGHMLDPNATVEVSYPENSISFFTANAIG